MNDPVFLDTSFAIALSSPGDQYHARAVAIAGDLKHQRIRIVTTRAVCVEIGNALSRRQYRSEAVQVLRSLDSDNRVSVEALTEGLYAESLRSFSERPDKDWGLTDCISFVLMQQQQLTDALTADRHFQQAGFRALLLDE